MTNSLVRFLAVAADILVPRFITEDVAVNWDEEANTEADALIGIVVPLSLVEPGEEFDAIVRVESFNLFGWALFPRQVGDVQPFVNPHDLKVSV